MLNKLLYKKNCDIEFHPGNCNKRTIQRESLKLSIKISTAFEIEIYIKENSIHLLIHFHYFLIVSIVEVKLHFFSSPFICGFIF